MSSLADPGLQPVRTALAWSRTGLAVFVNAAAVIRSGTSQHHAFITGLGVSMLVAAAGAILFGAWRRHRLMQGDHPIAPPTWTMRAMTVMLLFVCAGGLLSIVMTHRP